MVKVLEISVDEYGEVCEDIWEDQEVSWEDIVEAEKENVKEDINNYIIKSYFGERIIVIEEKEGEKVLVRLN